MIKRNSWLHRLLNAEIPDIPDRFGKFERLFLVGFIVMFTFLFIRTYPTIFLGFGLGDEYDWSLILSFFESLESRSPMLFYAGLIMLIANILFRLALKGMKSSKVKYIK